MVPLLILDVDAHPRHLRWTDTDRGVSICQANSLNVSFMYREELAFKARID